MGMTQEAPFYQRSEEDVLAELSTSPGSGLSRQEARKRLAEHGPNQLIQKAPRSAWSILISQLRSLVVLLLVGAAALAFALGDWTEGFAVLAVIAINTAIGFVTEIKAARSMEALSKMGSVSTRVKRDGDVDEVPASDLVPGDIVALEGGDIITADLRVLDASKMECDESALTGESMPVSKRPGAIERDCVLAERRNMLYKGTALTRGSGLAVVAATGMDTELGGISSLVQESEDETTPLEQNLDRLGRNMVWVVLIITLAVWGLGVARGKEVMLMLETAIALAVASIPEGLPIVATIALSRGMMRMAKRQALVRRLGSVETLGSTNVICTDKTGTLTENKMTVTRLHSDGGMVQRAPDGTWPQSPAEDPLSAEIVKIGVLCNNASVEKDGGHMDMAGDPLEVSLLETGLDAGIERPVLVAGMPEVREDAFDSDSKRMATFHSEGDGFYVAVKGAPEAVFATCSTVRTTDGDKAMTDDVHEEWKAHNEALACKGFRVLAVACKRVDTEEADPYADLVLAGLIGMVDPPRADIPGAIDRCHRAGIEVVMITGDQAPTALRIGQDVGIAPEKDASVVSGKDLKPHAELDTGEKEMLRGVNVFARVSPRQKLDLIALHQEHDGIVAMTGDGVNDAPALKKADIGIAMGMRGTQVACEAADVVLTDDSFKTIVYAVQEGRIIFGNIRKFVLFLLSCNVSEVLVIVMASIINTPLPILPLQILLLNLVTDVFPALALGVGEGSDGLMGRPPRPRTEPILGRDHWQWIGAYGVVLSLCTFGAFLVALYALEMGVERAVTVSFLTLAFSQLFHVFNMREKGMGLFRNAVTRNPWVWGAFALCTAIMLFAVYMPSVGAILHTVPLGVTGWAIILPFSAAPVLVDVIVRIATGANAKPSGVQ